MKIVIFGATGNIGQRIAREALNRGHEVTAVVRDPGVASGLDSRAKLVAGDATNTASVQEVVSGADAAVLAISPRPGKGGNPAPSLLAAARAVTSGLKEAGVQRLVIVGGAGSLEVAPGVRAVDNPHFPAQWKTEALAHVDALAFYRTQGNQLEWTVISPPALIDAGERTGRYRTGGDQLLSDSNGKSAISFEDYAVALMDEIETPKHIWQRMTVAY